MLSEECFQKPEHQLEFASNEHVVKFKSGDRRIPNTIVREGGGIGWMVNPIPMPNFVGSDCDDMSGHPCGGCPCGSGYPGGNTEESFPNRQFLAFSVDTCFVVLSTLSKFTNLRAAAFGKALMGKNTAIEDLVHVPNVPAGEYVVGFRSELRPVPPIA